MPPSRKRFGWRGEGIFAASNTPGKDRSDRKARVASLSGEPADGFDLQNSAAAKMSADTNGGPAQVGRRRLAHVTDKLPTLKGGSNGVAY